MHEECQFALGGPGSSIGIDELEAGVEAASLPPLVALDLTTSRVGGALAGAREPDVAKCCDLTRHGVLPAAVPSTQTSVMTGRQPPTEDTASLRLQVGRPATARPLAVKVHCRPMAS
jgi:hypothetical protein